MGRVLGAGEVLMLKGLLILGASFFCSSFLGAAGFIFNNTPPNIITPIAPVIVASTGTIFVADSFDGAGDSTLDLWTSQRVGSNWGATDENVSYTVTVAASDLRLNSGGGSNRFAQNPTAPTNANYIVELRAKTGASGTAKVGAVGRATSNHSDHYEARIYETGAWELIRSVSNAETTLANGTIGGFSTATFYVIKLDMNGTTIRMLIDGAQVASVTDSGVAAAGKSGMFMGDTGPRVDYFNAYNQ